MEQATELRRPLPVEVGRRAIPSERNSQRWLVAGVVMQILVAGLVLAIGLALSGRMDTLRARAEASGQLTEGTALQVRQLESQAHASQAELASLRQAVSSHAREESLFLKSMILKPSLEPELARRIAQVTQRECTLFGRDPNLVLAIIAVESDFNPRAVSSVGALGLMQVMPHWRKVLGINGDLTDPEVSIRAGIQILGFYQEMYGDLNMALTAYNRGPGPVDTALRRMASPANGYEAKVIATYDRLKKLDAASRP